MTTTESHPVPEAVMPVIADFTDWHVPLGFDTFEVVQKLDGPLLNSDGTVAIHGPVEYHYGVGHRAQLPDGNWLIIRPGDYDSYTKPGYFLGKYTAAGVWLWGQNVAQVEAALAAARAELTTAQRESGR